MADVRLLTLGAPLPIAPSVALSMATFALDGTTDAIEWIVQAKEAATITHVGFNYALRTGTPPTYRISIQGVDASGNPDGTIKGGGSPASQTFTPPASTAWDGTWQWIALANSYTCAAGEWLALVVDYSSGTINASNMGSYVTNLSGFSARHGTPYVIHNNAASRARQNSSAILYGYKSASAVYGLPIQTITATSYSANSTPDEYAMAFLLPGTATTYQLRGVRFIGATPAATKSALLQLYSGTTVLQTLTFDGDYVQSGSSGDRYFELLFADVSLDTLTGGTLYRIGLQAQENTANWQLRTVTAASAADLAALPGGANYYFSSRSDGGSNAWTDDTARRPIMELIVADITEPSAGAGLLVHPGMSGGMRG